MAAWGDIAVGERRGTWSRPSRSAILGLVAAALGIERGDRAAHRRFEEGLGFAVRVDRSGPPAARLSHGAVAERAQGHCAGRRAATNSIRATISTRSSPSAPIMLEMNAVVVLWRRKAEPSVTLAEIAARLTEPVFAPYLGRKSCPLGLPLMPHIRSRLRPPLQR